LLLNMKLLVKLVPVLTGSLIAINSFSPTGAGAHAILPSTVAPPSTDSLFKDKCAKCHGADGSGETSLGRMSNAPDFTDAGWWTKHSSNAERVKVITVGSKSMPAFGKKLTKTQITSLAQYVTRFKK
jgi:mono/diheme cytochrome c family protein